MHFQRRFETARQKSGKKRLPWPACAEKGRGRLRPARKNEQAARDGRKRRIHEQHHAQCHGQHQGQRQRQHQKQRR